MSPSLGSFHSGLGRRVAIGTVGLAMLAALAGCGDSSSSSSSAICGSRHGAAPATYDHVVWIWMENHSLGQIIGSDAAPYINQLASSCGLATNFHNITHVSLPNYI